MAWASVANFGNDQEKVADATLALVADTASSVNDIIIMVIATNNNATGDGDFSEVTSITDPRSNTWTKLREFTNGQGAAAAGATVSVWQTKVTTAHVVGDSLTINFSFSPAAKAATAWKFTVGVGNVVTVDAAGDAAYDGVDVGAADLTPPNVEHLWIRAIAHEGPVGDAFTKTAAYQDNMVKNGTTGGGAATNMSVAAEFDIFTGTTNSSDPTYTAADHATMLLALLESAPPAGWDLLLSQYRDHLVRAV